jgi:hypothetical protein
MDYRKEMVLLGLQRRLNQPGLSVEEQKHIRQEIEKLESEMQMD